MSRDKEIFKLAQSYENASYVLNSTSQIDQSVLLPSYVNAGFCIELYFKSLYFKIFAVDFKINNKYSHDFYELFCKFDSNLKSEMESKFSRKLDVRDNSDVKALEKSSGVKIPKKLSENLKHWCEVFVKLRYFYDVKPTSRPMMFFPEIVEVIKESFRED